MPVIRSSTRYGRDESSNLVVEQTPRNAVLRSAPPNARLEMLPKRERPAVCICASLRELLRIHSETSQAWTGSVSSSTTCKSPSGRKTMRRLLAMQVTQRPPALSKVRPSGRSAP
jgi:hypothetical protein